MATTRRRAAILAADVAGCPRLMRADEGTHERLKAHLRELLDPKINEHHCLTVEKIPATACWRNFRVLWGRRAARSKGGGRYMSKTRVEGPLGARRPRMQLWAQD
jgi:hypothetical protein